MKAKRERRERFIKKVDPEFKHRWLVYDELLFSEITHDKVWLDCGCGNNDYIKEHGFMAEHAVGADIHKPEGDSGNFILADIRSLPLPDNFVDIVTLRFVVEHLPDINRDFSDIKRILKPGGRLIILTTNIINPFVMCARIFPYSLKNFIITKLFRVKSEDVFKTYHRLNTPGKFKKGIAGFKLNYLEFISDLNTINAFIFYPFLLWHQITGGLSLKKLRTNILAVYEKL